MKAPTQSELMAKACRYCWFVRIVYIPRVGDEETCSKCGNKWEPASLGRYPKEK
jgi:hypothetical protein